MGFSEVGTMHRWIVIFLIFSGLILAGNASADMDTLEYTFCWSPSPTVNDEGEPLAPAEYYQVWIAKNGLLPEMIATVADDTTYTFDLEYDVIYRVRVFAVDYRGWVSEPSEWSDPVEALRTTDTPIAVEATMRPAYPNPFNPRTTLAYAVPDGLNSGDQVRLQIFDIRGQLVRDFQLDRSAGWHEVQWMGTNNQGSQVATGTYVARYVCGSHIQNTKLTLVK